jgi:hypothetical protein
MQTAQYGARDEFPNHLWPSTSYWLARDSLPNTLVGSRMVEVLLVVLHYAVQVSLAQDQDVVQAFSPHTTQEPLADRVCSWRSKRCPHDLNPCA